MIRLFLSLCFVTVVWTYSTPVPNQLAGKQIQLEGNRVVSNSTLSAGAQCRDPNLANYINSALQAYVHDMGALSKYVLDQIVMFRKPGKWLVHAEVIHGQRQGPDWQTTTNGDVFSQRNPYACYYHDQQTYILVVRLY